MKDKDARIGMTQKGPFHMNSTHANRPFGDRILMQ